MSLWSKLFGSASSQTQKKLPVAGYGSAPNPTVPAEARNAALGFICPTCGASVSVPLDQIDSERGTLWRCPGCADTFWVPSEQPSSIRRWVTSSVSVPIANLSEWYLNHPIYVDLESSRSGWMLSEHGFWGFCRCGRQWSTSVLHGLINFQLMKGLGVTQQHFEAQTRDSKQQMESLKRGTCDKCGSTDIVALVAIVPEGVRAALSRMEESDA